MQHCLTLFRERPIIYVRLLMNSAVNNGGEAMTTATDHKKTTQGQSKTSRKPVARSKKSTVHAKKGTAKPTRLTVVGQLRTNLMLTQPEFARLLPVSVRSLATIESGTPPTEPVARRLIELERLTNALSGVIKKESLGKWLKLPNQAFGGMKPVEVIERGESDRLWEMIYFLRSGVPS